MTARIRNAVLVAVLALLAVAGLTAPASAADSDITWSVVPSSPAGPDGRENFSYQVAPGTAVSDWVAVTNFSATAATFRVYGADATTDYDTAAFTLVGSNQSSTDLGAWTSVNGAASTCPDETPEQRAACPRALGIEVTLQPGQRADIPFTITVPHDAAPGDHSAGIVAVHFLESAGADGANVRQEARQGTRVYLRVDGPLEPGVNVSGLVSGYDPSWIPFAPGTGRVGFDVANTGNTRISAEPVLRLTGPFGIDLGRWELPSVANVVPGGTAHVDAELPGVPPLLLMLGELTVVPTGGDGLEADAVAPRYTGSTTAWAVPWSAIAALVLLVGVPALVIWLRRRRRDTLAVDLAEYREHILAQERARNSGADTLATNGTDR